MKKFIVLSIVFLASSAILNAQFFVGGGLNFSTSGSKSEVNGNSTTGPSSTSFGLSPVAGYILSENFYVGTELSFRMTGSNSHGNPAVKNNSTTIGIAPFATYFAFRYNKFSLYGQGQVELSFASSKTKTGGNTTKGPKTTTIGFNIFPGIAFDASEKVQLFANIDALNLGLNYSVQKQDIGGTKYVDKSTDFGFGANLNDIVTSGNITIGAIIKF